MANTKVKAEQLDLSDAVDIGIGIATPAAELHVNSTGENINLRLTRDTDTGCAITGTDGTNPVFRVATIASGSATERLFLNPTGLYPYTDVGLELGDSNNRWNRLEVKSTTSGNIHFEGVDTSAAGSFKTFELTSTFSGSDATGTDVANYGIYNQVDSSATGGDTSDEHRVFGMRNQVTVTGDSDLVYGGYNRAEAEHSSGQVSLLYGGYNYAVGDPNSGGTISNMYAAYNLAQSQGASGSTITNVYGGYNKVLTASGDDIGHTSLTACYAEIENDDSGQQNTTTTGYLFRGVYDDDSGNNAQYTNFYGLHIGGTSLSGNMTGSGNSAGVYLDMPGADVGFWNSEDQLNYFRGSLAIGSGAKNVANTLGMELHLVEPQGGDMIFARNDSSTSTNEVLGRIFFGATEDSGSTVNYGTSIEGYAGGPHSASDSEGYIVFKTTPNSSTTLTERMRINSAGSISMPDLSSGAGNADLRFNTGNGDVTYDTSSRLVKENIEDIPYGLEAVKNLSPKKYKRTDGDKEVEVGFIADEVVEVIPELVGMMAKSVFTKEESDTDEIAGSVNYSKMTAVLVKAIQEQQTQIEALQAEVKALKGG
tara:strand:- start:459 stop:2240 length:1782 start_codon:yes stop_codon:yes gene_type:complete